MADTNFPDEWLVHSLEGVVTPELVAELREKAAPQATLWETLVAQKAVNKLLEGMESATALEHLQDVAPDEIAASEEEASQRPVVRLVDLIISEGILQRSSDIHIEPEEGGVAVRYRIDGVLRQVMKIPRQAGLPLISRIKIMSSLDIADRLRPQDGRARVAVNGQPIDLRVATLPAATGQKVG